MFNLANVSSWHWNALTPLGLGLGIIGVAFVAILMVVAIALKAYALWTAAQRKEKGWFAAIFLINTAGILELIYLAFIVKKWSK